MWARAVGKEFLQMSNRFEYEKIRWKEEKILKM